ncbi:MAG: PAS domain S-box protein [Desulfobacteraceae bacterium]|nr:PAS domain S-box protein [Desulfobacteraceae bacterium]
MAEKPTYEELERRVQEMEKNESEYKSSMEALRNSEVPYLLLFEHANVGIFVAQDGYLKVPNPYLSQIVGYSRAELEEQPLSLFIHPEFQSLVTTRHQERLSGKTGLPQTYDFRVITKNGTSLWVQLSTVLIQFNGRPATLNFLHDITERKQAEEEVRERGRKYRRLFETMAQAEELLRNTFDLSPIGKALVAPEGPLLKVNAALCRILGYSKEELLTKIFQDIIWPDDLEALLANNKQLLMGEIDTYEMEIGGFQRDESLVWAQINVSLFRNSDSKIFIAQIQDITERKQAEKLLIKKEALFRGLFDHMTSGSAVYEVRNDGSRGADYIIREFNRKSLEMEGKKLEEVMGRSLFDLRPNINDYGLIPAMKKVWETGSPECFPTRIYQDKNFSNFYENHIFKLPSGEVVTIYNDVTDQKNQEKALQESEKKYRALFDTFPLGITVSDQFGNIVESNAVSEKFLGIPKTEHEARTIDEPTWRIIRPDGAPMPAAEYASVRALKENRQIENVEMGIVKGDTEITWINVSAAPLHLEDYGVVVTYGDITERRLTEEALRESEARFRSIYKHTAVGLAQVSLDFKIMSANEAYCNMLGYQEKNLVGRHLKEFTHPDVIEENIQKQANLASGKIDHYRMEKKFIHKKGQTVHAILDANLIRNASGNAIYFLGSVVDITERKQAEMDLQSQKKLLEGVFDSIKDVIGVQLPDHTIVQYNRAGYKRLGLTEDQVKGKKCYELLGKKNPCHACPTAKALVSKKMETIEKTVPELDGYFICTSNPVLADNGDIKLIIEQLTDITEKKKIDEKLQQSQKMESIGSLAGGIAHDFNNLLFPIVGLSEMMLADFPPDSPEHHNLHEIFLAGKRGRELVQQILSFSRQSEKQLIPVHIQKVLKEVFNLCRATIPADIPISRDIQTNCNPVMADPTQIHQIAMNFITNAYHAVEPVGGTILIQLTETDVDKADDSVGDLAPGRYAMLSVSDTGTGIDPAVISKIFDPYFTTKEKGRGTGLGLATVYGIVKTYGGEIRVLSDIGKGTTFTIYLPLLEKAQESEPEKEIIPIPTGTEHILLVDDEQPIVNLEKQMLERLGYHATIFTSSADALAVFRADPTMFDLVITDMNMPHLNGMQLAEELVAVRPDIPIIICTGFSERIDNRKAEAIGIRGLLMKPMGMKDLAQKIREVMDSKNPFDSRS